MTRDEKDAMALVAERLLAAGVDDVVSLEPAAGGLAATAGLARRRDGSSVFVKAFGDSAPIDAFDAEVEGLEALRSLGGATTPEVLLVTPELLVLEVLEPRPPDEGSWVRLAEVMAHLHTSTAQDRIGWHRDN